MIDIISLGGIKIKMIKDNDKIPFVQASWGMYNATFSIRTGKRISGEMPEGQENEIETWIIMNEKALKNTWDKLK